MNTAYSLLIRLFSAVICGYAPLASPVQAAELTGRVVAVADGDTLTMLVERKQMRIRLADIDAPEKTQPFGNRSRQSLSDLCHSKSATVQYNSSDRYGRTIGSITCAGIDANAEQVRRGMAWVYDRYARKDSPLYALQDQARASKAGLWRDAQPVPPWEFRQANRK